MALHGKHKQARRTLTFMSFLDKPAAVLFCTDVAARGLDFPQVDWVLQVKATCYTLAGWHEHTCVEMTINRQFYTLVGRGPRDPC